MGLKTSRTKPLPAWKVFALHHDGSLRFLFHGVNGSKRVLVGRWLKAKRRMVRDGTGGRYYLSGFHVFLELAALERWLRITSKPAVVACVLVKRVRNKSRFCIRGTVLADEMFVPSRDHR